MTVANQPPKGVVVVCVGFDEETPPLIKTAVSLARRTGADLRLVHVVEPNLSDLFVVDMPLYGVSPAIIMEAQTVARQQRAAVMKDLLDSLPGDVRASSALLSGDPASAIATDAQDHGANLILTACHADDYGKLTPSGFSVALGLMAKAPLPVIVTSHARPLDFDKARLTVLLADDLQDASEEAARKTFELAAFLPQCRVRQVHVHGDFRDVLRNSWLDLKARYPALQKDVESPEGLLRAEYEARLARLGRRGGSQRERAVEHGTSIEVNIRTGPVVETLIDEVREVDPDLIAFGRHRTLKARPFLIGRMGLHAMLQSRRAVLVVPPHNELYAPMAFPAQKS